MSNRPKLSKRSQIPGYTQKTETKSSFPVWGIVGIVVVVIVIAAAIAVGASGGNDDEIAEQETSELAAKAYGDKPTAEFRPVEVTGEALPELADGAADLAVGMAAPKLEGANFINEPVAADEGPAMLVFGAHWCHVCQAEVPKIAEWIGEGMLPEGVDATLISTATKEEAGTQPPSLWVPSTGWDQPIIVDSDATDAATAYGLTGFPFIVFIDADGNITQRASGGLPREQIEQYLAQIAPSAK